MQPDWAKDEVEDSKPVLTAKQIERLLSMTETLRKDYSAVLAVALIKEAIEKRDYMLVKQLWEELSEKEQEKLYIAPSFGGVFTTFERKVIKHGENHEAY